MLNSVEVPINLFNVRTEGSIAVKIGIAYYLYSTVCVRLD